ncbi:DUF5131 family protein [Streptosporangium sp. NPDC051023]|uniref:DUF5131 family protein n=1 Tax=Streptosporangium sp. NPDC051023 TaxID=3155410 RepID=UPI00344BE73F
MANDTSIAWTDYTINAGRGCTKVSPGCDYCYSERDDQRWGNTFTTIRPRPKAFADMFALSRKVARERPGDTARVFLNSMTDTFHPAYSADYTAELMTVMALTPNLTYQVLTKRHARLRAFLTNVDWLRARMSNVASTYARQRPDLDDITRHVYDLPYPLSNVHFGVSAESQEYAHRRIPKLLAAPAGRRFVSIEPMLGPVDLETFGWLGGECGECQSGTVGFDEGTCLACSGAGRRPGLDWVILGGESGFGTGYRPVELEWMRDVVAQCREAGVAVFVKQLGTAQARRLGLRDFKGEGMSEWPADLDDLRVREFPVPVTLHAPSTPQLTK